MAATTNSQQDDDQQRSCCLRGVGLLGIAGRLQPAPIASRGLGLERLELGAAEPLAAGDGTRSVPTTTWVSSVGPARVVKEMPLVTSVLLAMSQALANLAVPTGSNCTEQSPGSVSTKTGVLRCASASAGLAASAIQCEAGK